MADLTGVAGRPVYMLAAVRRGDQYGNLLARRQCVDGQAVGDMNKEKTMIIISHYCRLAGVKADIFTTLPFL